MSWLSIRDNFKKFGIRSNHYPILTTGLVFHNSFYFPVLIDLTSLLQQRNHFFGIINHGSCHH